MVFMVRLLNVKKQTLTTIFSNFISEIIVHFCKENEQYRCSTYFSKKNLEYRVFNISV